MLPGRGLNPGGRGSPAAAGEGLALQGGVSGLQADHPSLWAKGHLLRASELRPVVVLPCRALQ